MKKPRPVDPEDLDWKNQLPQPLREVDPGDPEWVEKLRQSLVLFQGDTYVRT